MNFEDQIPFTFLGLPEKSGNASKYGDGAVIGATDPLDG